MANTLTLAQTWGVVAAVEVNALGLGLTVTKEMALLQNAQAVTLKLVPWARTMTSEAQG